MSNANVKDPACDRIMAGAQEWAALTIGKMGPADA